MSKYLLNLALAASLCSFASHAEAKYNLGRAATGDEVAAWNTDIRPDGQGLPDGEGSVMDGEPLYLDNCAVCHGDFGEAVGRWPVLAGGDGSLSSEDPVKTIGSYWPYLSTVYDYVHRAMPFGNAESLTDDEVYAITAYLMYLNDLVDEDFVLSKANFQDVRLPNEENFFMDDRAEAEASFKDEPCMENCKTDVQITKHATVLDVTPEDEEAGETAAEEEAPENMESEATDSNEEAATEEAPAEETTATEEAAAPAMEIDTALAEAGEKVFKKCKACHQVGEGAQNKTGPALNGVVGSPAGHIEDFKYSKDMAESGLVWDEATLAQFLAKPKALVKKTKMSFAGLKKEDDIKAIIEYLKTFPAQ